MKKPSIELTISISALLGMAAAMSAPALADTSKTIETTAAPTGELPFFARFLEGQESPSQRIALTNERRRDGEKKDRVTTRKFPSDNEGNNGGGGVVTTQKFPSDNEDNSGGNPVTAKFPSDNEDNSGGSVGVTKKFPSDAEDNTGGGGIGVTKKFPSDNEDNSGGGMMRRPHR